jgi:hypothetical protein
MAFQLKTLRGIMDKGVRELTRQLDEYEIVSADVALAFFKYVNMFNLLERNIVLCISGLDTGSDRYTVQARLSGLTTQAKLEVLKELIAHKCMNADSGLGQDFDQWFTFATKSKAARNRYVHGYWDIAPELEKAIRFTPNQWIADKDSSSETERMTMPEFLGMMEEMNRVFDQFGKLRSKHGI